MSKKEGEVRVAARDDPADHSSAPRELPDVVRDAASFILDRAPAMLAASTGVVTRAAVGLRDSSTGTLALGAAFSAGMSVGMLIARAPRPLVAVALSPALVLGATLVERLGFGAGGGRSRA